MAIRTTTDAVAAIIEYDTTLIPDLTPFIESANLIVNEVIAFDSRPTAASLELVERYLSAHLVAITDPRVQAEQVKSLQQTFQVRLSDGLGITHYGATAMLFDSTGRLANWNKRITSGAAAVSITWAGTDT